MYPQRRSPHPRTSTSLTSCQRQRKSCWSCWRSWMAKTWTRCYGRWRRRRWVLLLTWGGGGIFWGGRCVEEEIGFACLSGLRNVLKKSSRGAFLPLVKTGKGEGDVCVRVCACVCVCVCVLCVCVHVCGGGGVGGLGGGGVEISVSTAVEKGMVEWQERVCHFAAVRVGERCVGGGDTGCVWGSGTCGDV